MVELLVGVEEGADAACAHVTDDGSGADVVFEHPQGVAPDQRLDLRPQPVLKGLDRVRPGCTEGLGRSRVGGFERVAEEFSEVAEAVEGESDDSGAGVGADDHHGQQGPDEAGDGPNEVEEEAGGPDDPTGRDGPGGERGDDQGQQRRESRR